MERQGKTKGTGVPPRSEQLDTDRADRPETVLSVLEADQLVAAKERSHMGRSRLSPGVRVLLWGLRLYVIAMLILVAIQVVSTIQHGVH